MGQFHRSIFALADDLTGALEAGAKLRLPVTTQIDRADLRGLVVDTETRHLTAEQAAARVEALARRAGGPSLIYKKTDSTLRGNIAAELGALHRVFPDYRLVYVPAYPALGRTVRHGELYVDGAPVHRTVFAADPLNPITSSRIDSVLNGLPVEVIDGESDADIHAAAERILNSPAPVIVAGPAAIAAALAGEAPAVSFPAVRRCLVVNGSAHPASLAQIARASFDDRWVLFEYAGPETGLERAHRIGLAVKEILGANTFDAILVFGGDTAYAIHSALGAPDFTPLGEILSGVPVSRSGSLTWITKAGGFGAPDLLLHLKEKLS